MSEEETTKLIGFTNDFTEDFGCSNGIPIFSGIVSMDVAVVCAIDKKHLSTSL